MTLQRFEGVLLKLQKEAPRLYDALRLLNEELKTFLDNEDIQLIITDGLIPTIGTQRNSEFRTVRVSDLHDFFAVGESAQPLGKLQVTENTNDHVDREVVTVKRSREDCQSPNANFGANLSFRLQGFTVRTEPEAGRVQVKWEQNQTNDTTQRDSEISLWNMINNSLTKRFAIASNGAIAIDASAYPAGRIVYTGPSGVIQTDAGLLFDDANDIVSIIASNATVGNAPLIIRQDSTADAYTRYSIATGNSFSVGIDNSDSDQLKVSFGSTGNAAPGTNDYLVIDTAGRIGIGINPSTNVKVQIFKTTSESIVLTVAQSDTNTTPSLQINQASTGDATLQWTLGGGNSYAVGIDNSDADKFKVSYGAAANAALGTNDRISMDVSGRLVINGSTITSGRLLQLNHIEEGSWIWCEGNFTNPAITLNNTNGSGRQFQVISTGAGGTGAAGSFVVRDNTGAQNRLIIDPNGCFVVGHLAALATNATNGFLYIPSCAGTPTGVPTAFTGKVPMVYDSTNNILYVYSGGAWRAH